MMTPEEAYEFSSKYEERVREAAGFLKKRIPERPRLLIILGSGQQRIVDGLMGEKESLPYDAIPHFPAAAAPDHEGALHIGIIEGLPAIVLQGRSHHYERDGRPYNADLLVLRFPVDVAAELEIPACLVTNAAGGLDPSYEPGDIMAITDHDGDIPDVAQGRELNLKTVEGKRMARYAAMHAPYDAELTRMLINSCEGIKQGAYFATQGPSFETRAKVAELRRGGFSAVGMSTVPEVTAAIYRGMRCAAYSLITNAILPSGVNKTSAEEVLDVSKDPAIIEKQVRMMKRFCRAYSASLK